MNELPAEVAAFLSHLERLEEELPKVFNAPGFASDERETTEPDRDRCNESRHGENAYHRVDAELQVQKRHPRERADDPTGTTDPEHPSAAGSPARSRIIVDCKRQH